MTKTATTKPPLRVGLISLGCAKNLVDAEIMLGALAQAGLDITNDAATADVVIVNTCSFIDAAQEESVDAILQSAHLREAHQRGQGLIVAGCLPQRYQAELPELLPEVDVFMGIDQVTEAPRLVAQALQRRAARLRDRRAAPRRAPAKSRRRSAAAPSPQPSSPQALAAEPLLQVHARPRYIPDFATPRFRLTPRHFAYVKIAEGCNHPCSFCIIPRMRGSHRSRPQADLVQEARQLIADGAKELNLISQDSTYYGLDLRPTRAGSIASPAQFGAATRALPRDATTLRTLLRALNDLPGDFWIRLLYTHPAHWTDELIAALAECPKVARYVDIPLQHIHPIMLERMRRETTADYIIDLLRRIRQGIPGIALRTTFIVGFPGETEACFQELLAFIRATRFERLGVFTYSREDGTRAGAMSGQVPDPVKEERRRQAMAVQQTIAREIARGVVGTSLRVLVESQAKALPDPHVSSWEHGLIRAAEENPAGGAGRGRLLVARSQADAPDIDGRVYVRGRLPIGEFATVRVVGHTDYDLLAETANPNFEP